VPLIVHRSSFIVVGLFRRFSKIIEKGFFSKRRQRGEEKEMRNDDYFNITSQEVIKMTNSKYIS